MTTDRRTYIKLHDGMPEHPKVDGLSDKAFRGLIETWCWCARNLTDGHVPAATWRRRVPAAAARELVAAKLAEENPDGSVQMHDYLQHQTSKAQVEHIREVRSVAGKRGGRPPKTQPPAKQTETNLFSNLEANHKAEKTQKSEVRRTTTPTPDGVGAATSGNGTTPKPQDDAQRVTAVYVQHVPMSNFPAVQTVVRKAFRANHSPDSVQAALLRLAADKRPVTTDTLRIELEGKPASNGHQPYRNPDPSEYHQPAKGTR